MSEDEWLEAGSVGALLTSAPLSWWWDRRMGGRGVRLFLCAVARAGWIELGVAGRLAVVKSELSALENETDWTRLEPLRALAREEWGQRDGSLSRHAASWALKALPCPLEQCQLLGDLAACWRDSPQVTRLVPLLREVIGNPFRPLWADSVGGVPLEVSRLAQDAVRDCRFRHAHDRRRLLDLADALLACGCDDRHLLAHLIDPAPHPLGCWAVTSLLPPSSLPHPVLYYPRKLVSVRPGGVWRLPTI